MKEGFNIRIKDLETIKQVFDSFGVRVFIVYGALLGFYRDGTFLPEDDDIDLCVIDEIDYETRKKIGWTLYDLGFRKQGILFNVYGRMEEMEEGYNGDKDTGIIVNERNFKFTIFFFKKEFCKQHNEEEYVCIPKLGSKKLISTPTRFFSKTDTIKIGRNRYLSPSPIKDYLNYSYYNNYKDKKDRRHSPLYPEIHQ